MSELETLVMKSIAAHGQWKVRVRQAIDTGKSEWSVDQVKVDDQCVLGQWIYADAVARFPSDPLVEEIREPHRQFHQEAAKVLSLALMGRKAEAERLLELGSAYAEISGSLVRALQKLGQQAA
jgi:methyl-accepting chemotaxis protein